MNLDYWVKKLEDQLPRTRELIDELQQERKNVDIERSISPST